MDLGAGRTHLRVEEDLWAQEALVANVDRELPLGDCIDARVLFDPSGSIRVVLVKLLHQVRTHVAEALLSHKNKSTWKRRDAAQENKQELQQEKLGQINLELSI